MRRAAVLLALAAAVASCRHKERLAPVDFAAGEPSVKRDSEATLAPSWPAAVRADLKNGAMLRWLHEPGSPAFHARLLLPITAKSTRLDASTATVVITAAHLELTRRLRRFGAKAVVSQHPGRVEIALHGHDEDAERIIDALTVVLSNRKPGRVLAQAQGKAVAAHAPPNTSSRATAALVATLLGFAADHEQTDKQALVELSESKLERGWFSLLDPRDAVLVVHSGRAATVLSRPLSKLSGTWTGKGLRSSGADEILERLRPNETAEPPATRILAEPKAPLRVVDQEVDGRAIVTMGRLIPTPTVRDRAYARLTQRMLQEELDARLLVVGDVSILAIRIPLSKGDPAKSIERAIERLDRFAASEHQPERMEQAASLWLGARVVEASLDGEDWTALWSESLDLADDDASIGSALAQDAQAMLEADAKAIHSWQERWILPRGGEPGWVWVAAGIDDALLAKLAALTPIDSGS